MTSVIFENSKPIFTIEQSLKVKDLVELYAKSKKKIVSITRVEIDKTTCNWYVETIPKSKRD